MTEIFTKYDEEYGEWLAYTAESPYLCVGGNTEAIARSVAEKGLRWYNEKRMRKVELEVLQELSQMVRIDPPEEQAKPLPWKGPGPIEDTAPSEMSGVYDHAPYMNGENGC